MLNCVVTSALCLVHSVTASQNTCITNTVRSKKNNILCNNVTFTLLPEQPAAFEWPCKWNREGGGGGGHGLVAMGACILRANPWWFDWGPWQWTALTFDPVQPESLYHSQTHLREPRADCPKIVSPLIRRIFFSLNENLAEWATRYHWNDPPCVISAACTLEWTPSFTAESWLDF